MDNSGAFGKICVNCTAFALAILGIVTVTVLTWVMLL